MKKIVKICLVMLMILALFPMLDVKAKGAEPLIPVELSSIASITPSLDKVDGDINSKIIMNMTCPEDIYLNIYLYYINGDIDDDKKVDYVQCLDEGKKINKTQYEFEYYNTQAKYEGYSSFKLVGISVSGIKFDEENEIYYRPKYFSPTDIDFGEYEIFDELMEISDDNYFKHDSFKSLDFKLKTFYNDTTAPRYVDSSFKWNQDSLITPDKASFSLKMMELENESGISGAISLIFNVKSDDGKVDEFICFNNHAYNTDESLNNEHLASNQPISFSGLTEIVRMNKRSGTITFAGIVSSQDNSGNSKIYIVDKFREQLDELNKSEDIYQGLTGDKIENIPFYDHYQLSYNPYCEATGIIKYTTKNELTQNIKTIIESNDYEGNTYLVDCTDWNLNYSGEIFVDQKVFELIYSKNINLIFNVYAYDDIQWCINGNNINKESLESMKNEINLAVEQYLYNDKLIYTSEDQFKEGYMQAGVIDTPLSAIEYTVDELGVEEFNKYILSNLNDTDFVNKPVMFKYYIDYLNQFDIKTTNYLKLFNKEYNKYCSNHVEFANNGKLPGEFTIRVFSHKSDVIETQDLMNLYYVESDGTETLVQENIELDKMGWYDLKISHNSTYVLRPVVKQDEPIKPEEPIIPDKPDEPVTPEKPNEPDKPNTSDKSEIIVDVPTINPKDEVKEVTVGVDNAEKVKDVISNSIEKNEELKTKVNTAIAAGKDIKTEVVVKNVEETKIDVAVQKEIDDKIKEEDLVVVQYLDLSIVVYADNEELGNVKELSEEITYTIAIPADLAKEGREFVVVRVHDGVAEILPTTMNDDGTLSFKTDRFSTYALAYKDAENKTDVTVKPDETVKPTTPEKEEAVNTGDQNNVALYASLCTLALFGAGIVVLNKKRLNKK